MANEFQVLFQLEIDVYYQPAMLYTSTPVTPRPVGFLSRVVVRLQETAKVFARLGPKITALFVADRLLSKFFRAHILVVQIFAPDCFAALADTPEAGAEVRIATYAETLSFARRHLQDIPEEFVDSATSKGDTCVGVFVDNELVSVQWFSTVKTRLIEDVAVSVNPDCLYAYNAYTAPDFRGRHFHAMRRHFAGVMLAKPNGLSIVSLVNAGNAQSLFASTHLPASRTGAALLWRHGNRRVLIAPICRAIGLGFHSG